MTSDLELLRLHLTVARKRVLRIVGELLHPIAQLRHMHAQVLRSLHIGHASFLDQAHSLKLELAGKLPSLHDPPPAPSKHLTRCLRNRMQAKPSCRVLQFFQCEGPAFLIGSPLPFLGRIQVRRAVLPRRQAPRHEMEITRKLPIQFLCTRHNRHSPNHVRIPPSKGFGGSLESFLTPYPKSVHSFRRTTCCRLDS